MESKIRKNLNSFLVDRSFRGNARAVKALLKLGADVHVHNDLALRLASAGGWTETVKVLLDAGADVHARNDDALLLARAFGNSETVKLLEAAAASPPRPPAAAKPPAPAP